jgi:hypothetical protein
MPWQSRLPIFCARPLTASLVVIVPRRGLASKPGLSTARILFCKLSRPGDAARSTVLASLFRTTRAIKLGDAATPSKIADFDCGDQLWLWIRPASFRSAAGIGRGRWPIGRILKA